MHQSEEREVNCIHTKREMLTVFILAQKRHGMHTWGKMLNTIVTERSNLKQHKQGDVDCIHTCPKKHSMYTLGKTLNALTCSGRCKQHPHNKRDVDCFLTCTKKHTACAHEERNWIHQLGQGGDNSILPYRKMMSLFKFEERELQHANIGNDAECIHQKWEKSITTTQTQRSWLYSYLPKATHSMRTWGKLLNTSACTGRGYLHLHRKNDDVFRHAGRTKITAYIREEWYWAHQIARREANSIHTNREKLTDFLLS